MTKDLIAPSPILEHCWRPDWRILRSAVLLIGFNRPESARRVFAAIREARPPRFYLAVDGPRADRPQENAHTAAVTAIAKAVDWPCEIKLLAREQNLGCRNGVAGALDWFFEHEEEGVVLEDDCLPTPEFFWFMDEMLARYRTDPRVAQIGGSTFVEPGGRASYYWTKYADIWGWGTWRRAWALCDLDMAEWPTWRDADGLSRLAGATPGFVRFWTYIFDKTHAGLIDTWDFQWMFACWQRGLLTALPGTTQILNLGFGADATHTAGRVPAYVTQPRALYFPLIHPDGPMRVDASIERRIMRQRYEIGMRSDLAALVERLPLIGSRYSIANRERGAR